jgi:N-acyl-D-aspartate/D-glutamate deacylase
VTGDRLVIRGGMIADGFGGEPFEGDIEVAGGLISQVGRVRSAGKREIDARGLLVTPGFVDVHTHYDGHLTWGERILPSSMHGITTVVVGNCGVGFAPCRARDRERLVCLMEGVEDIPRPVFDQGLPWAWETFPEYLDFLETRRFDVDVAAYLPHAPLRIAVMGDRAVHREAADDADLQQMRRLATEAVNAGAIGFSTSRIVNHRSSDGGNTPMYGAATEELVEIARGLKDAGKGLLQVVAGFTDPCSDFEVLRRMTRESGRPLSASLAQSHERPGTWREVLEMMDGAAAEGLDITAQVYGRAIGMLMGLNLAVNPFSFHPGYARIAHRPLAERLAMLAAPEFRNALLAEVSQASGPIDERAMRRAVDLENVYELGCPPNYEPAAGDSIAARARAQGCRPEELAYDLLLADEGRKVLMRPLHNYADRDLEACRQMLMHARCRLGLADGGAHCGYICDAGYPTFMLSYWTRDRERGPRLPLGAVVKALSRDAAQLAGMLDRGVIAAGYKADINVIDYDQLQCGVPYIASDLPGGGRRLLQRARGYVATLVSGVITGRDDEATGMLPGRLVRCAK